MDTYAVVGPTEAGTGPKTAVTIIAASTVRPAVCEIDVGVSTAPADQTWQLVAGRFTAAGTAASNPTPEPLDPNSAAALATAGITHSAEPTYTASKSLLDVQLHVRATYRWVASPGRELKAPATASNGIGVKNHLASASSTIRATVHFSE